MRFFFIFILTLFLSKFGNSNEFNFEEPSSLEIVPKKIIKIGDEFFFGIKINLDKGWKTYWKNPGDTGFPMKINWIDDKNIEYYKILYPFPSKYTDNEITTIGYEKEVIFPIKVKLKNDKKILQSNLEINYLVCKDLCIPKEAIKHIKFNFSDYIDSVNETEIYSYLKKVPHLNLGEFEVFLKKVNEKKLLVRIKNDKLNDDFQAFTYSSKSQYKIESIEKKKDFTLKVSAEKKLADSKDGFFLVVSNGKFFEEIFIDLKKLEKGNKGVFFYLFLAFLGGVLLNFMPCVLPVLSLKLYSFISIRREKKSKVVKFSISTILGIIFSFFLLSAFVCIFRMIGVDVGWGFQFQNEYFLILISTIILFFSLNLFGFFEILSPQFLTNKITKKFNNPSYLGHFLSGAFATLLATPCSAPFLGTAIGFSLMASNVMIFFIFFFVSLGFSFPYIIFLCAPRLINYFPKPGKWMSDLKYLMGIFLILSFAWLLTLLEMNLKIILSIISIIIFLSVLIERSKFKYVFSALIFAVFFVFFFDKLPKKEFINWEDFNEKLLDSYLEKNNLIFLDFTADWCATCQMNKVITLNSNELRKYFLKNNVKTIRGDWTKKDKLILNFISRYNRFGIPVNIVFGPKNKNGQLLPEILTKDLVLREINLVK